MADKIQIYTKFQLAKQYGVHTNTLIRWIKPFEEDLKALGYNRMQKRFLPIQIRFIYQVLGEP